ncbi:hypothetical protein [Phenylobacterium sp.]|jgi:hypothetical protein|uniref:hypothetical protein n=1 Tax=Phenylobacterium sp. TaxID=1871053 RepID=UPI002F9213B1
MTHQDQSQSQGRGPTTAQLRDDIQSGRTGDKVAGFDPAAAPLGVDDEAGGVSPTPEQIALAREQETAGRPNSATTNAATPELQPNARAGGSRGMAMGLILGVAAAAVLALILFTAL